MGSQESDMTEHVMDYNHFILKFKLKVPKPVSPTLTPFDFQHGFLSFGLPS